MIKLKGLITQVEDVLLDLLASWQIELPMDLKIKNLWLNVLKIKILWLNIKVVQL